MQNQTLDDKFDAQDKQHATILKRLAYGYLRPHTSSDSSVFEVPYFACLINLMALTVFGLRRERRNVIISGTFGMFMWTSLWFSFPVEAHYFHLTALSESPYSQYI